MRYSVPVVVNHGVLFWASGCESLCVMLSSVVGNHGVLCQTSGCESWFVMLGQLLGIMDYYAEPVLCIMVYHAELVSVNHGGLC